MRALLAVLAVVVVAPAARAETPLAGTLSGREFRPAKILLYDRPNHHELQLVERGSADCSADFGSHMWLHVRPAARFVAGRTVAIDDAMVTWSTRKKYDKPTLELTFDRLDPAAGVAAGRLVLRAPDGTDVSLSFEARYCGTREVAVAEPRPAHGVAWNLAAAPAPKKLPAKPATGWFLGAPFTPVFVSVVGYEKTRAEIRAAGYKLSVPPVVTFFAQAPSDPCVDHQQARGDRFVATLDPDKPVKAGTSFEQEFTMRHADGTHYDQADSPRTLFGTHKGRVAVRIDAFDRKKRVVKGRVYLAVDDASKSLLVGSFVATYCSDPTGA